MIRVGVRPVIRIFWQDLFLLEIMTPPQLTTSNHSLSLSGMYPKSKGYWNDQVTKLDENDHDIENDDGGYDPHDCPRGFARKGRERSMKDD